ncbi:MAG: hypothetical protein JXA67_20410 [Micromonosporaceae bacterium]|nr:hypothetical protein [Micromonosporaceae bacterium]
MSRIDPKRALVEVVLWSAFLASGGHIYQVAVDMGNHPVIAAVHAIGLDGLVYIGIGACIAGAWTKGVIAVAYGGLMSLAFNFASYSSTGVLPAWVIAASMPVSLTLAVLVGHGAKAVPTKAEPVSKPRVQRVPVAEDKPKDNVVNIARKPRAASWDKDLAAKLIAEGKLTNEEIGERVGTSYKTVQRYRRDLAAAG